MDYVYELKELLRPLRIYRLDEGAGAAELRAIGEAMNRISEALDRGERNSNPLGADGDALEIWERLLPYAPAETSVENRRNAVAALLSIDGRSFTIEALNRTLYGCGIRANVEEAEERQTVNVFFPDLRGKPEGIEEVCMRIEQILPCHLAVNYVFIYLTWAELEQGMTQWLILENKAKNWRELECWMEV